MCPYPFTSGRAPGRDGVGQLVTLRPVLVLGVRPAGAWRNGFSTGDLPGSTALLCRPVPRHRVRTQSPSHTPEPAATPPATASTSPLSAGPGAAGMPPPRIGGKQRGGPTVPAGSPAAIARRGAGHGCGWPAASRKRPRVVPVGIPWVRQIPVPDQNPPVTTAPGEPGVDRGPGICAAAPTACHQIGDEVVGSLHDYSVPVIEPELRRAVQLQASEL